jgi:hypothetical protein
VALDTGEGNSATFAKIIRHYNLETGSRVSAAYLSEAINIPCEGVERSPAFSYRGKPRPLFIRNARIRYADSLGRSCAFRANIER